MKTRIFLVAMALMVFASLSFGQGFCSYMYGNVPPVNCDGSGGPIPEGTQIHVYWDQNGNGPDASDPLATAVPPPCNVLNSDLCGNPPTPCLVTGPGGYWETLYDMCAPGCMPAPATFYLVIYCPGTTIRHWWTDAHTFASGPQEWEWVFTHCDPQACIPSCNETIEVTIQAPCPVVQDSLNVYGCRQSVCLDLCAGHQTTVHVCGNFPLDAAHAPVSSWVPGCDPVVTECDRVCTPASVPVVTGPFVVAGETCWTYVIIGGPVEGCLCFTFQYWLAASIDANSFTAVAGDNEVTVNWTTLSESNVESFRVTRNGEMIGNVPAENSPSGATYHYTDGTAVNGTTYTYGLKVVNSDNSITETNLSVSATPSFNAAVITEYALHQNFPNPFNPTKEIVFDVLNSNPVTLKIYNAAGQEVATLLNGATREGGKRYVMNFDATNLTSGLYFYTVKIGSEFSATKKMLLVK
jgi:hypothetical protein